ncbi:hypothetical protein EJ05DRAFT_536592 [Pseudovirgaria hyperparasitica]|uniref:Uncharacterized protein n=1 Tax=Pseudovirgaria hyperparasitica TaxID=470096 RepID=A0A6A6WCC9_9PEZI|nr:uncharacterized protein EJ05DRAFT_536592 [Pseudovirgaria hyperparasitica]KAF2760492.1 hypothetical protein EJ05DRAFT_536592 [Pseudovirgaria hyperparasitica]
MMDSKTSFPELSTSSQRSNPLLPTPPISSGSDQSRAGLSEPALAMHQKATGYTNSITWESKSTKERKNYLVAQHSLERLCPHSPVRYMAFREWMELRQYHHGRELRKERKRLYEAEERMRLQALGIPPLMQPFGGKIFEGNRTAVLSQQSIWCRWDWDAKPELAEWPCSEEMRYQGDGRAQSKLGRFLALPRYQPNFTVGWDQCRMTAVYPFDEVNRVPTEEDVCAPVDEILEADIPMLLNQSLLDALDDVDDELYFDLKGTPDTSLDLNEGTDMIVRIKESNSWK